jgi:preprotein translocase subunit SecE
MAPSGKKKKDGRDGTARRERAAEGAPDRPRRRRAETAEADPRPGDAGRGEEPGLPGGLAVPGRNLIGPGAEPVAVPAGGDGEGREPTPAELGVTRYVHAALFVAGIVVAFVGGKILALLWNLLADWHAAVQAVPAILHYGESERATITGVLGVVIGVVAVVQTYRKEKIRRWADEVAGELAKVTWPSKDTVTNGTIVVIVASIVATVYVALLDQFWGFVTRLIYEA